MEAKIELITPKIAEQYLEKNSNNYYLSGDISVFDQTNNINPQYDVMIIIPVYNAKKYLEQCINSILTQETKYTYQAVFIDDGSTDNTKDVVDAFLKDNQIEIKYIYKENGGLHTGYNTAIENLDTELSICIDSDDWLPDDAIDIILTVWNSNKSDDIAGLIGLDYSAKGEIIGDHLPNGNKINPIDLLASKNNRGDKNWGTVNVRIVKLFSTRCNCCKLWKLRHKVNMGLF